MMKEQKEWLLVAALVMSCAACVYLLTAEQLDDDKRDRTNSFIFVGAVNAPDGVVAAWKPRVVSYWLSARYTCVVGDLRVAYGSWHAVWTAVALVLVAFTFRCGTRLLSVALVYCGLFSSYTSPGEHYHYPWDGPALCAMAGVGWAYARGGWVRLLLIAVAGSFFKETCGLGVLLLFGLRRWAAGLVAVGVVAGIRLALMLGTGAGATPLQWMASGNVSSLLVLDATNPVLHLGVLVVVLGARPLMWRSLAVWGVVLIFSGSQLLHGSLVEYRVFAEALPLLAMLVLGQENWSHDHG